MCQSTELIADFLDEPVPTTSPTKAKGKPFFLSSSIFSRGLSIFLTSIDFAWTGISGLDQASVAGDKSSVLVSPGTLKTVSLISLGSGSFEVNHVALDQLSTTFLAYS